MTLPTRADMLTGSDADFSSVAPASVVLVLGGTRRAATLRGIDPHSDAYLEWSRAEMLRCVGLLFDHGVQHVFSITVVPHNLLEFAKFRAQFVGWIDWGVAGDTALADYARLGWRARILGAASLPELAPAADRLVVRTSANGTKTLWWAVVGDPLAQWQDQLRVLRTPGVETPADAIRTYYGEDVPPAEMLIAFGKPVITPELLPPFLLGHMHCYWTQRPSYGLDHAMVRAMLYDYAYVRPTGAGTDRSARYADVLQQRAAWETDAVLGVGQRLGAFWYPAPFPSVPTDQEANL